MFQSQTSFLHFPSLFSTKYSFICKREVLCFFWENAYTFTRYFTWRLIFCSPLNLYNNKFIWKELTVTQYVVLSFPKVNRKCLGPKQYFSLRVICFLVSTLSDSHLGLQGGKKRLPIWHILPKASPETRIHIIHLIECWFP